MLASANTDIAIKFLPEKYAHLIDSVVNQGISNDVFPGCQVYVLWQGEVIFNHSYGYQTYDSIIPIADSTLYDMASVTKAAATTLAVMKLYDEGRFLLSDSIGKYLHYLKGTDKEYITIDELLTHTSGMPAFIPFYRRLANQDKYISNAYSFDYGAKIADNCYLRIDMQDSIRMQIAHCKLKEKKYIYSDLNFFFLKEMVETIARTPIDQYLQENFYAPMGLTHTVFNPLDNGFDKTDIAPTEWDTLFRHQLVQGYVHDQTAALFDGNAGNAGLFSTAHDIAVIFQMLLDGGTYQGQRLLSEETVRLFTTTYPMHDCFRRSLGFDTPCFAEPNGVLPAMASNKTFGHQGFTGNVVWCDPDKQLIYVFVSNRVYPSPEPNKLVKSQIRLILHNIIYQWLTTDK